jgi:hypothetical protein
MTSITFFVTAYTGTEWRILIVARISSTTATRSGVEKAVVTKTGPLAVDADTRNSGLKELIRLRFPRAPALYSTL